MKPSLRKRGEKKYYYSSKQRQVVKDRTRLLFIVARVVTDEVPVPRLKLIRQFSNFNDRHGSSLAMSR